MEYVPASASDYHRSTSYSRTSMGGGALDWLNQPGVYKSYQGLAELRLPWKEDWPAVTADSPQVQHSGAGTSAPMGLDDLSQVLALSYGITARRKHSAGESHFRSAPSAGALYPCELYVAVKSLPGLDEGLYHYDVARHGLTALRVGPVGPSLGRVWPELSGRNPSAVFFISTIIYRSAWKYRERSYRYLLLDSGHLLENLMVALNTFERRHRVTLDFRDEVANEWLGFDPDREMCLAMVCLEGSGGSSPDVPVDSRMDSEWVPVQPEASRVSAREQSYPAIVEIHRSSSRVVPTPDRLDSVCEFLSTEVQDWPELTGEPVDPERATVARAILRRRSRRNFVSSRVPRNVWKALVADVCRREADESGSERLRSSICIGMLCEDLEDVEAGFYLLDREGRMGLVREGRFLRSMAGACLGQDWLARAAMHFVFLMPLETLEAVWGPRAYRYGMMEAGRIGQRIYLSATGLGLGACGIGAFFDDEVTRVLNLNNRFIMTYLVGVGPVKKMV